MMDSPATGQAWALSPGTTWTNWVGNQTFAPRHTAAPVDEAEVVRLVRDAAARGATLRVAGAGHSFTPLVETDGVLLDLSALAGIVTVDRENQSVTALAGTTIAMFGEPLWDLGLALHNQGDIDTQQIAGAVATGTHGSGIGLRSFSAIRARGEGSNGPSPLPHARRHRPKPLLGGGRWSDPFIATPAGRSPHRGQLRLLQRCDFMVRPLRIGGSRLKDRGPG